MGSYRTEYRYKASHIEVLFFVKYMLILSVVLFLLVYCGNKLKRLDMNTIELIYHFTVLLSGILLFFMKYTANNGALQLLIIVIGKVAPVFMIGYSLVVIFKHFQVI